MNLTLGRSFQDSTKRSASTTDCRTEQAQSSRPNTPPATQAGRFADISTYHSGSPKHPLRVIFRARFCGFKEQATCQQFHPIGMELPFHDSKSCLLPTQKTGVALWTGVALCLPKARHTLSSASKLVSATNQPFQSQKLRICV